MPPTARHSIMKDGFVGTNMSFSIGPEPFEDPSLHPGFVRTTKEYLKQSHLKSV